MSFSSNIGLALQEAREAADLTQTQMDEYLHRYQKTSPGSLKRWERGESLPPSKIVLDLLTRYNADIYLFMRTCGLEEAVPIE